MEQVLLKDVIEQRVRLSRRPNASGWQSCVHATCDHGRKGSRAAFRFEDASVWFHCFNCGKKAAFIPSTYQTMSKEMIEVLNDFGIAEVDWKPVVLSALVNHREGGTYVRIEKPIEPDVVPLPSFFYKLTDDKDDDWAQEAIQYLKDRHIEWQRHQYFLARADETDSYAKKWIGRIIVPIYKDNKLIYYFGRDMSGTRQKKYLSVAQPRDKVLYGYDQLDINDDIPLFICEGFFDAHLLNGVAVFGDEILTPQIQWLNRCRRQKIIVPDRNKNGFRLAKQGVSLDWLVSTPDFSRDCTDVSDAVERYGILYTMKSIRDNTSSGAEALAKVKIYCGEK